MNGNEEELDEETPDDTEEDIDLGELGTGTPHGEVTLPPDAETPEVRVAKAQARADALEEELRRRDAAPPPERREIPPVRAVETPADTTDYAALAKEFVDSPDPGTAFRKLAENIRAAVVKEVVAQTIPAGVSQGLSVVQGYLRDKRDSDPEEYAIGAKYFNEKIALIKRDNPTFFAQLANAAPAQVDMALTFEWDAAVGKGERENREKRKAEAQQRRAAPAPTLTGRGSGGGTAGPRGASAASKLTPLEQTMVRNALAAGLTEADAKDIVREHRREQRGA
jgi:hypothetical protein